MKGADLEKLVAVPSSVPSSQGRTENLLRHLERYQPNSLKYFAKVAGKLKIPFEDALYIGEFIFVISRDNGREDKFISYWEKIANYLELHRICGADGPTIGLAAAAAGYEVHNAEWLNMIENNFIEHIKAMSGKRKIKKSFFQNWVLGLAITIA